MPTSTDNQDYNSEETGKKPGHKPTETATGPVAGDLPLSSKDDQVNTGEAKKQQPVETGPAAGNLPLSDKNEDPNLSSDDFTGKKVDADPSEESGKPADQK